MTRAWALVGVGAAFASGFGLLAACGHSDSGSHDGGSPLQPDGQVGEDARTPEAGDATAAGGDSGDSAIADGPSVDVGFDAGALDANVTHEVAGGTRLKAEFYVTPDGAEQFVTWYDMQVGAACGLMTAADGAVRCLPYEELYVGGFEYSNSACTDSVAAYEGCGTPPAMALATKGGGCPLSTHVYTASLLPSPTLYENGGGTCVSIGASAGESYYALGAEQSPSSYVGGTFVTTPYVGGLALAYFVGSDGSHGFDHAVDETTSQPCYFNAMTDQAYHCTPGTYVTASGGYADSACSHELFETAPNACDPGSLGISYDFNACPEAAHVYQLGALVDGTDASVLPAYVERDGGCTPYSFPIVDPLYASTSELPPSSFATATFVKTGTTRLQEVDLTTAEGTTFASAWWDTQLNIGCTAELAADGQLHCIPSSYDVSWYSDSACTRALASESLAPGGGPLCGETATTYAAQIDTSVCPSVIHVYAVGPSITPSAIYAPQEGECQMVETPTNQAFFSVGAEVSPSTFESFSVVMK